MPSPKEEVTEESVVAAFADHQSAGAVVGALIAVTFFLIGGDAMRQNVVAIFLGAPALISTRTLSGRWRWERCW